ncbi:hypothetical protein BP6252_13470 [Coleophoma cylindrospora]|uniref:Uncharacterized protein n=1 Tax=Coleophoma cylindrospora TaxID=1849047 RepID=A0A3D8Q8C7_9HELO|nr:hypothetical protein BP6252_13470 [Coleophoma cylindrospora]
MGRATSALAQRASRSRLKDSNAAGEGEEQGHDTTTLPSKMAPPHHPRPSSSKSPRKVLAGTFASIDQALHKKSDPQHKARADLARAAAIDGSLKKHEVAEGSNQATVVPAEEELMPLSIVQDRDEGAPEIEIGFGSSDARTEAPADEGEAASTMQLSSDTITAFETVANAVEPTATPTTETGFSQPTIATTPEKEKDQDSEDKKQETSTSTTVPLGTSATTEKEKEQDSDDEKQETATSTTGPQRTSTTPASPKKRCTPVLGPGKAELAAAEIQAVIRKLEDEKKGVTSRVAVDLKLCRQSMRRGNRRGIPCNDPDCIRCHPTRPTSVLSSKTVTQTPEVQAILSHCKKKEFEVSATMASSYLKNYEGQIVPAMLAIAKDLDSREQALEATGRICLEYEKNRYEASAEYTGLRTRDEIITMLEIEDEEYKEYDETGTNAFFTTRMKTLTSREEKKRFAENYEAESEARKARAKTYHESLDIALKDMIPQEDVANADKGNAATSKIPSTKKADTFPSPEKKPSNLPVGTTVNRQSVIDTIVPESSTLAARNPFVTNIEDVNKDNETNKAVSDDGEHNKIDGPSTQIASDGGPTGGITGYDNDISDDSESDNDWGFVEGSGLSKIRSRAVKISRRAGRDHPTLKDLEMARAQLLKKYKARWSKYTCSECDQMFPKEEDTRTVEHLRFHVEEFPNNPKHERLLKEAEDAEAAAALATQQHQLRQNNASKERGETCDQDAMQITPAKAETILRSSAFHTHFTNSEADTDESGKIKPTPVRCDRCNRIFPDARAAMMHLKQKPKKSKCYQYFKDFLMRKWGAMAHEDYEKICQAQAETTNIDDLTSKSKPKAILASDLVLKTVYQLRSETRDPKSVQVPDTSQADTQDRPLDKDNTRTKKPIDKGKGKEVAGGPVAKEILQDLPARNKDDFTVTDADGMQASKIIDDRHRPQMIPSFIHADENFEVGKNDRVPEDQMDAAMTLTPALQDLHERLHRIYDDRIRRTKEGEVLNDKDYAQQTATLIDGPYPVEDIQHVMDLCFGIYKYSWAESLISLCLGSAALAVAFTDDLIEEIVLYYERSRGQAGLLTLRAIERETWRFILAVQYRRDHGGQLYVPDKAGARRPGCQS